LSLFSLICLFSATVIFFLLIFSTSSTFSKTGSTFSKEELFTGEQEFKKIKRVNKNKMKPGLYIVATPIGNLDDISIRSQKTLDKADIIICENPKHSLKLLAKLGIKKKMYSLHDHNEDKIITKIENHVLESSIILMSDAGSPLISDPGYKLVQFYINKKLHVTTIPGPSSIISSLQISGMAVDSFKFLGFAPKNKSKFEKFIENLKCEYQTSIFFVSSHRLILCLETLEKKLNNRKISVCKELTKLNEKIFRGYAKEIVAELKQNKKSSLGEFVILVEGSSEKNTNVKKINTSVDEQIIKLLKKYTLTDVVDIVHKLTNISKKVVYKKALEQKK